MGDPKAPPGRMVSHPPPLRLLRVAAPVLQRPLQNLCGGRGHREMSPREGEGAVETGALPSITHPAQHHLLPPPPNLKMMGKVWLNPHRPRDEWGN